MDIRGGEREDLWSSRLPETHTRGVHSRCSERAAAVEGGGAGAVF